MALANEPPISPRPRMHSAGGRSAGIGPDDGAAACMANIIAGFRTPGVHRGLRAIACPNAPPSRARNPASRRPWMATA